MHTDSTLRLDITLPRLSVEEVSFLIHWAGSRTRKFPHFCEFVLLVATDEMARRINPGSEAAMVPLPTLSGTKAACFLMGSYTLARMPLSESLASFADDLGLKILSDIAGTLEMQDVTTP